MNDPDPPGDDNAWLRRVVLSGLVALPLVGWLVFVLWAGFASHDQDTAADIPQALRLVGAASGTALATIAGSFLGIKPQQVGLRAAARMPRLSVSGWATAAYFVGLLVAVVIWALDKNRAYAADVVQTALATLFGFGIGALKAETT